MRRRLILLALAVFVAADILLVTVAVRHAQGPFSPSAQQGSGSSTPSAPSPTRSASSAASTPSSSPSSSTSSDTASSSSSPSSASSGSTTASNGDVAFVGLGEDPTLVRATRGNCFGSVTPEVSVSGDRGASFASADVPGLTEVLGLRVTSQQDLVVVGLGRLCRITRFTSDDGGRSWGREPGLGNTWALSPRFGTPEVASPRGVIPTPCTPRAVSTVSETLVRILCKSGQILGTNDVGATWVTLGTLRGAVDITFATAGEGVALASRPGCPAAVLRSVDGGSTWSKLTCLTGSSPQAIGSQGTFLAAEVGDSVYVSRDSGATWSAA